MNKLGYPDRARFSKARDREFLRAQFGKAGDFFHQPARAEDDRPMVADQRRKSLGAEAILARDLLAWGEVAPTLEPVFVNI